MALILQKIPNKIQETMLIVYFREVVVVLRQLAESSKSDGHLGSTIVAFL